MCMCIYVWGWDGKMDAPFHVHPPTSSAFWFLLTYLRFRSKFMSASVCTCVAHVWSQVCPSLYVCCIRTELLRSLLSGPLLFSLSWTHYSLIKEGEERCLIWSKGNRLALFPAWLLQRRHLCCLDDAGNWHSILFEISRLYHVIISFPW